jgi:phosphatidylglycerol:prolipoprotein diacylglycerol transferase
MPTGFQLGPLYIHFYGIILMLGALAAAFLAEREARRRGQNSDLVWDGLVWVLIGGIIGARIWHILTPPQSMVLLGYTTQFYLTHPLDMLAIWNGGLGIPGGVIGGSLALFWFTRRNKLSFALWADIAAPAVALGQAIGRWGNFVNQELYGAPAPANLPWKIFIAPEYRLKPVYQDVAYYHPLFLYESLWNFANMFFLLWLARRHADRLKQGDLFLIYMVFYAVGRFFLEFVRLDPSHVGGFDINQALMAVVVVLGSAALIYRHRGPADRAGVQVGVEPVTSDSPAVAPSTETPTQEGK